VSVKLRPKGSPYLARPTVQSLQWGFLASILAACGGSGGGGPDDGGIGGGGGDGGGNEPPDREPPDLTWGPEPDTIDTSRSTDLAPGETDAYWIDALLSDDIRLVPAAVLQEFQTLNYAFPQTPPIYLPPEDAQNWEAASAAMQTAFREMTEAVSGKIDIEFAETEDVFDLYTIAVQVNDIGDPEIAAYAYFPSLFPVGFDIFIDASLTQPAFQGNRTNFDYEVLLHELGHTLGLKHPFEAAGFFGDAPLARCGCSVCTAARESFSTEDPETSASTLSVREDNSQWTAMTYSDRPSYWDGEFRPLDLMALAHLYGVAPDYRAGDDFYEFSTLRGTFVLDGGGADTIYAGDATVPVVINLVPESWSWIGEQDRYISDAGQLTISSGSWIEAAVGGAGDDWLIGNSRDNLLVGNGGNDMLFGGEGADTLVGGPGSDVLDFSEEVQAVDTYVLFDPLEGNGADLVGGFRQGDAGDAISHPDLAEAELLSAFEAAALEFVSSDIEIGGFILRLTGTGITSASGLEDALEEDGTLERLVLEDGETGFLITAETAEQGETQLLFGITQDEGVPDALLLAAFVGNELDIDLWTDANFV